MQYGYNLAVYPEVHSRKSTAILIQDSEIKAENFVRVLSRFYDFISKFTTESPHKLR